MDEAQETGENIVAVAHYRNLKTAEAWYDSGITNTKVDLDKMRDWKLPTGSIFKFYRKDGKWKMDRITNK